MWGLYAAFSWGRKPSVEILSRSAMARSSGFEVCVTSSLPPILATAAALSGIQAAKQILQPSKRASSVEYSRRRLIAYCLLPCRVSPT